MLDVVCGGGASHTVIVGVGGSGIVGRMFKRICPLLGRGSIRTPFVGDRMW